MAGNRFGTLLTVTSWGESHGTAIGCVVDGVPPLLALSEADIQPWLDRRRPGQSRYTSQRRESDQVTIKSGVFEGRTTGAPIALEIANEDIRPADYEANHDIYRPGHADLTYDLKYGIRDHRGGGRSSARETATRVAAGAIARLILGPAVTIRGAVIELGGETIDRSNWDNDEIDRNSLFCPDGQAALRWASLIDAARKTGSSLGAIIEITAKGVPPGLGEPVFGRLDADLAAAMMSINAVKGVEIGAGFAAARLTGEINADQMRAAAGKLEFRSNHAGGILGGISTGQPIVVRFAVKPTSSIRTPLQTVTRGGNNTEISTRGRHDPCVGIRAVPVGEAMLALTLADHLLRQRALTGRMPETNWPFAANPSNP